MDLLQPIQDALEGRIDFTGQVLAERIAQLGLGSVTAIAFVVGWAVSSVYWSMMTFLGGSVLVCLIIIPQWPMYRRHPVKWLPARTLKSE